MMPSSSTAKIQSSRDRERRVGGGWSTAPDARISHKRQLRITRNFAYYAKVERSTVGVELRSFIIHNRKFCAQTTISYKKRLGAQLRWWDLAAMNLAAMNLAAMNLAAMNEMNKP